MTDTENNTIRKIELATSAVSTLTIFKASGYAGEKPNKAIGKKVKLIRILNPERQEFVNFSFGHYTKPGHFTDEEGRYLSGELDAGRDWLVRGSYKGLLLDVRASEKYEIKAYQRVVTLLKYDSNGEYLTLPKAFRKTQWIENHKYSNERFEIEQLEPLPLQLDSYQILKAAQSASLSKDKIEILRNCRSPNDAPGSTVSETEFKVEVYDEGRQESAIILRVKEL